VVHSVRFLHFKSDNSNVSIERKYRGNSRGAWSLKNAEEIKNYLVGMGGRRIGVEKDWGIKGQAAGSLIQRQNKPVTV
jgi:hypothetical protein